MECSEVLESFEISYAKVDGADNILKLYSS
jgi:hypothetical protein